MVVKTFRGILANGGQEIIRLSTIQGKVGYRIVKLDIIGKAPGATSQKCIVKVYHNEQSAVDAVVNFTDSDLLGTAIWFNKSTIDFPVSYQIVFDREIFNQDIYITHKDLEDGLECNYYLELEVIPLDEAGAEYTTLKDMRQA